MALADGEADCLADLAEIGRLAGELGQVTGDGVREATLLEIATVALRCLGRTRAKGPPRKIGFPPRLQIRADRRDAEADR